MSVPLMGRLHPSADPRLSPVETTILNETALEPVTIKGRVITGVLFTSFHINGLACMLMSVALAEFVKPRSRSR